jgi:cell division protein FtsX
MEFEEEVDQVETRGEELKSEIGILKGQINALIQVAVVQQQRPPYAPEPMSTLQSTSHVATTQSDVNIQQTVDLAKIMKNINIIKEKLIASSLTRLLN